MTSEDVKRKINSCLADINQLVMAEHQFEEDRIDIIRFGIVAFFNQPFYKYFEKVKDDYSEQTEGRKHQMKSFKAYLGEKYGESLGFKSRARNEEEKPDFELRQDMSHEEKMETTGKYMKYLENKKKKENAN
jgi:hypothetical protein